MRHHQNGHHPDLPVFTPKELRDVAEMYQDLANLLRQASVITEAIVDLRHGKRRRFQPSVIVTPLTPPVRRRRRKPKAQSIKPDKRAHLTAVAAVLDRVSRTEPTPGKGIGRGVAMLVRNGYLTKVADGYLRTEKVFDVGV